MTVRIVTDSTADLPAALAQDMGIVVVPLNVHFDDEVFTDGVTIQSDEFYQRLVSSSNLPKTSQPAIGAFMETYQQLLTDADGIVSVHVSSQVSGTVNAAQLAVSELGSDAIEVVDTLQASLALGLIAMAAAKVARNGGSLAQVVAEAKSASQRARFFGLVETLEYLEKGGRIGKAQALLGSLLRIKPILTLREGIAHPVEKVRTRAKGLERLAAITAAMAPLEAIGVMSSDVAEDAKLIVDALSQHIHEPDPVVSRFGPVLGTYLGPGSLGVAMLRAKGPDEQ
jgi:DegV family protein with EDD domain